MSANTIELLYNGTGIAPVNIDGQLFQVTELERNFLRNEFPKEISDDDLVRFCMPILLHGKRAYMGIERIDNAGGNLYFVDKHGRPIGRIVFENAADFHTVHKALCNTHKAAAALKPPKKTVWQRIVQFWNHGT